MDIGVKGQSRASNTYCTCEQDDMFMVFRPNSALARDLTACAWTWPGPLPLPRAMPAPPRRLAGRTTGASP
eukprot:8486960-Alexandrium_andersonii.AAC.1